MLKKIFFVAASLFICLLISCKQERKTTPFSFETGSFKTYLENKKDSSSFYRTKDFQIETYRSQVDTFHIEWKNKFEFRLLKVNPKSKLDSTEFVVKITKIKDNSYEFQANYVNNNFKQKGSTIKISDEKPKVKNEKPKAKS
ncbi:hypothetical protein [Flavicella sediminum]|uniref:hypothetical protein n=1 Tax=Flavicella sediminum TaxID=2585141 RepID=UPI001124728D|nr:hypothetical protein [Flavicella sediminum]